MIDNYIYYELYISYKIRLEVSSHSLFMICVEYKFKAVLDDRYNQNFHNDISVYHFMDFIDILDILKVTREKNNREMN